MARKPRDPELKASSPAVTGSIFGIATGRGVGLAGCTGAAGVGGSDLCRRLQGEREIRHQRRRKPGHLLPLRAAGHTHSRAIESLFGRQSRRAKLTDEFVDEQAMLAAGVVDDGARRRGVHHQRAGRGIDRGKSGRHRPKAPLERISPRRIEHGDLDLGAAAVHLLEDRIETDAVAAHVRLGPDLSVDRNDVALPRRLDGVAAEEHQGDRAGLDLAVEAIEGACASPSFERFSATSTSKPMPVSPQLVGQGAGVLQRLLQRGIGIGIIRIADDQGQPRNRAGLLGRGVAAHRRQHDGQNDNPKQAHVDAMLFRGPRSQLGRFAYRNRRPKARARAAATARRWRNSLSSRFVEGLAGFPAPGQRIANWSLHNGIAPIANRGILG